MKTFKQDESEKVQFCKIEREMPEISRRKEHHVQQNLDQFQDDHILDPVLSARNTAPSLLVYDTQQRIPIEVESFTLPGFNETIQSVSSRVIVDDRSYQESSSEENDHWVEGDRGCSCHTTNNACKSDFLFSFQYFLF